MEQHKSAAHRDKCFGNSARVRGECLAGQSHRLVTLHFSMRVSTNFGLFSAAPFNLKMKKQTVKEENKLRSRIL